MAAKCSNVKLRFEMRTENLSPFNTFVHVMQEHVCGYFLLVICRSMAPVRDQRFVAATRVHYPPARKSISVLYSDSLSQ